MDNSERDKDKELISFEFPKASRPMIHLLLGLAIFILALITLSLVGYLVAALWTGVELSNISAVSKSSTGLKILNFFGSALPFLVAAFAGTLLAFKGKLKPLLAANTSVVIFGLSLLFFFLCLPLTGVLLKLNSHLDLSFISRDLHTWFIQKEAENNALYELILGNRSAGSLWVNLIFMALIPAVAEELFFRGFMLNTLFGKFKNIHLSIVVSALIFALIHMQVLKLVPMMFLGIIFGYIVYWTGTIWTSVLAHFLNNAFAVYALYFVTDGNYDQVLNQQQYTPTTLVVLCVILALALAYYIHKNAKSTLKNYYV